MKGGALSSHRLLAILTVNLAWHGWLCINNRRDHSRNRVWHNLASQALLTVAAANCAWQGWLLGQPLMIGISIVGLAEPCFPRRRAAGSCPRSASSAPSAH